MRPGEALMPVISRFTEHPGISIFVVGDDRRLLGVITGNRIQSIMRQPSSFAALIIAQDMMDERGFPTVAPTDTLADVMRRLGRYRGEVPVVEGGRLVGAIWPEDVIERYNAEVFKREMAFSMASSVGKVSGREAIPALENTSMAEIPVPVGFVGRSLGELDIRAADSTTGKWLWHAWATETVTERLDADEEISKAVPLLLSNFPPAS